VKLWTALDKFNKSDQKDEPIIDFMKINKDFFMKRGKELSTIIIMFVGLVLEVGNLNDYTAGKQLLFEPMFMVQARDLK
jgi:hypothetical protein